MSEPTVPSNPATPPFPLEPVPQRPTSVTTIAILGIIFGAFGFLCTPASLIPYFVTIPAPPGQTSNPATIVLDTIKNDSLLFGWTFAAAVVGWALSGLLLAGSIGALGLKQWARQILIACCIINIALTIVQLGFNFLVFLPKMRQLATDNPNNPAAASAAAGGIFGILISVVFGLGVPITFLIILTRPNVKDAFVRGLRRIV